MTTIASFRPGAPSKLTLEQDEFIYEALNPEISLTMDFNYLTIEARCSEYNIKQKETMENSILDNLEAEVKKEKKEKTTVPHPDYDGCDCITTLRHSKVLKKQEKKEKKAVPHPDYDSCDCVDTLAHSKILKKQAKKASKVKARTDRFPKEGGRPIKASVPGYSKIPWTKTTLTLIAQSPDGQIHYAKTIDEKKQFAWSNFKWILVCWPGQYTQDIFLIDDMTEFRKALGFKKKSEAVVLDEQGDEWLFEQLFAPKTGNPYNVPKSYSILDDYKF